MSRDRMIGSRWTQEDLDWFNEHGFEEMKDMGTIGQSTTITQIYYSLPKVPGKVEVFKNDHGDYVVVISCDNDKFYGKGVANMLSAAMREAKAEFRRAVRSFNSNARQILDSVKNKKE